MAVFDNGFASRRILAFVILLPLVIFAVLFWEAYIANDTPRSALNSGVSAMREILEKREVPPGAYKLYDEGLQLIPVSSEYDIYQTSPGIISMLAGILRAAFNSDYAWERQSTDMAVFYRAIVVENIPGGQRARVKVTYNDDSGKKTMEKTIEVAKNP